MTTLLNIAKMTVSGTPGTGNITLGSAVTGWQSFASAGATNGMVIPFNAVDGSNQQDGTATYSTTGPSLTSISITDSTTGSPLSLTSAAIISLTARAQDIVNKTGDNCVAGFTFTPNNLGNITSFTINPSLGNYQYGTNHAAATWTAPTSDCAVTILVTNDATAGTITFSGFTVGASVGDTLTTTSTQKFLIMVIRINSVSTYTIKALQ